MRILFGGTFDPIHNGHIKLALHIAKLFNSRVEFLPLSGVPNYKPKPVASVNARLDMLNLAISGYDAMLGINYSEIEIHDYTPTYLTLRRLRARMVDENEPLYFIIGGDSLIGLDSWDNWQELFLLTNFIVAMRTGYSLNSANSLLLQELKPRIINMHENQVQTKAGQIILTDFEPVDISSTQIRYNCANGLSIDGMVSNAVYDYIYRNKIYAHHL